MPEIERMMIHRYAKMTNGFMEVADKDRKFKLAYCAARDMLPILRFCIPVAAELAMLHRPEYVADNSALYRVVMMYVLCMTEKDQQWEAMITATENLYGTPEMAEAATIFGSMLSYVILQYILFMPYMLDTMGEVWPAKAETMLSGLVRIQALEPKDAKAYRNGLIKHGMFPELPGLNTLMIRKKGWFGRLLDRFTGRPSISDLSVLGTAVPGMFKMWMRRLAETGEVTLPKGWDNVAKPTASAE